MEADPQDALSQSIESEYHSPIYYHHHPGVPPYPPLPFPEPLPAEPNIPARLFEITGANGGRQKMIKNLRSNHYIVAKELKNCEVIFFTNQRLRKAVLIDLDSCLVVFHDSVAVQTGTVEIVNAKNCRFLFDQCDLYHINCYNVTDCQFQFTDEDGVLTDEHIFTWDERCTGNELQKANIVRGTDPNMHPELPLMPPKAVYPIDTKGVPSWSQFTPRAHNLETFPVQQSQRTAVDVLEEIERTRKSNKVIEGMTNEQIKRLYDDDLAELADEESVLLDKVRAVARLIKSSRKTAVFAGAGISTSASLPDYRGPQGTWTLLADGQMPTNEKRLSSASPTLAHYAICELVKRGLIEFVATTNMDGLFFRTGMDPARLAELHGSCFREICYVCHREYRRVFDCLETRNDRWSHKTGRLCECGEPLRDSIVHFTERWTFPAEVEAALTACYEADLVLALGSSMLVQPSCAFARKGLKRGGRMVLVNLQRTPVDNLCSVKVYCKTDRFFDLLMKELDIPFEQGFDLFDTLPPQRPYVDYTDDPPRGPRAHPEADEGDDTEWDWLGIGLVGAAITVASLAIFRFVRGRT